MRCYLCHNPACPWRGWEFVYDYASYAELCESVNSPPGPVFCCCGVEMTDWRDVPDDYQPAPPPDNGGW